MPVTNEPDPQADPAQQDDWERLHYLVTHLVSSAFTGPVQLITTDRTGKVDGGWVAQTSDGSTEAVWERVPFHSWLNGASQQVCDFALTNLGGMLRLYATHPARNPLISVQTYDEWPALVEVRLYE